MSERGAIKAVKGRAQRIWSDAMPYRHELSEIYRYFMPWRQSTIETANEGGGRSAGQPMADMLFDASGVEGCINFAGQMQSDWMPYGEPFMALEPGPIVPENDEKHELTKTLQRVGDVVHGVLAAVLSTVAHEMCFDLFAGTGAMLILRGDQTTPIRALSVPAVELALRNGPYGQIWHVVWRRRWRAAEIPVMWPKAKISKTLAKRIKDAPDELIEITQYTFWDATDKIWVHYVWAERDEENALLAEDAYRVTPWITPRFFVMPGESFGRGFGHLALPFVKTANKSRELALHAAAFAIMGIFTRRADNVFNPDTAVFQPLAFWQVSSNGGAQGPTIQRLPVPADFDISSIVMQEERDQIRRVLMNDELPDDMKAVRSATEVAGRLKRYARRYGGVNARMGAEWIAPTVARTVDILEDMNLLAAATGGERTNIRIDNLLTKVTVKSPAVAARRADRVEQAVNYLQIASMLFGPQAALLAAKVQDLLPEMGRWIGVEEKYLPSKAEQQQLLDLVARMVATEQAKAAMPAQPEPAPGAQYMNGGGI